MFEEEYGVQTSITFSVLKAGSEDLAASADWTPATGDVKISKDGGAVANTTNLPTAVTGTGSVLWALTLTSTEMQASDISIQIVDSATKAIKDDTFKVRTRLGGQIAATKGIIVGEVDSATFTPTTTQLEGFRIAPNTTEETTADHYNGRIILFTSGAALGESSTITDYELANSKEKFTFDAIVSTLADGDTYVVL